MSYVPAKKNTAYITYIDLVSQADTKLFQVNPTIASGDFKVSIDGGSFANLTTLPVVTPAGGRAVKISLSSSEMNGDNINIQCVDAAGAEWCDYAFTIQTVANQIDDLSTKLDTIDDFLDTEIAAIKAKTDNIPSDPADASDIATLAAAIQADTDNIQTRLPAALVGGKMDSTVTALAPLESGTAQAGGASTITLRSGASAVNSYYLNAIVSITGGTGAGQSRVISGYVGSTKVATVDRAWATNPDSSSTYSVSGVAPKLNASGEVVAASVTGAVDTVNNPVTVGTNNDKTGYALSVAGIQSIWDRATSALTTSGSIGKWILDKLDVVLSTRLASASYTAPDNASITAIKAKTDLIPAAPAAVADIPTANANADALLDRTAGVETSWTLRQALRIILATCAGKLSGAATTTVLIRDPGDAKNRVSATVDASGNRSAVSYDKT